MTASELPVGAQFTLAGDYMVYTVTDQTAGYRNCDHLTGVRSYSKQIDCYYTGAIAGHTEVIAHPLTVATDSANIP